MEISLSYSPHPGQQSVHDDRRRFRAVCAGRRWGKTRLAAADIIDRAGHTPGGGDFGWIAPTYLIAERGVDACKLIAPGLLTFSGRSPTLATFAGLFGPVRLWFLTADNPDSILGFGFRDLVIDEAARIPADVWTKNIRPTLSDTQGGAMFISTPYGRNWFFDQWTRGRPGQGSDPACGSYLFPSDTNPYFPPGEMEEARRTLPEDVYRQEYLAEFLEDSAGAFRGIAACIIPAGTPVPDATRTPIVIGCDVAKHTDWTVLIAMDALTGRCLAKDRFQRLDWPAQEARILDFLRAWPGKMLLDATGAGDPVYDNLRRRYADIEPFVFTGPSKVDLIQSLIVAIEQRKVSWPAEWTDLTDELMRYEYHYTAARRLDYNAPSGFHDDTVIALALANSLRAKPRPVPASPIFLPRPPHAPALCLQTRALI